MKKVLATGLLCAGFAIAQAAPLNIVNVGSGIACLFNTNCVDAAVATTNTITLPGTTGSGLLQTRVITGVSNAPAAGLFAYEYKIDLSKITGSTNTEPCLTNVVRSLTNSVISFSNVVTFHTNRRGRVTVDIDRVPFITNVVRTVTNTVPCPGTAPCIESLSLNFRGLVSTLDLDTNSATRVDQVYVVTNAAGGGVVASSVTESNGMITLNFSNAICPGEASVIVGLVSSNAPANVTASLGLSFGADLRVTVPGPGRVRQPIPCDLSTLARLIHSLDPDDFKGPNIHARRGHLKAIEKRLEAIERAVQRGDIEGTLEGLISIIHKAGEGRNTWVGGEAGQLIIAAIQDLLDCLEEAGEQHGNGDGDDGDRDDDDDDRDDDRRDRGDDDDDD